MTSSDAKVIYEGLLSSMKAHFELMDREREFYSYLCATAIVNLQQGAPGPDVLNWLTEAIEAHNSGHRIHMPFTEIALAHEEIIGGIRYETGTYRMQRIGGPPDFADIGF